MTYYPIIIKCILITWSLVLGINTHLQANNDFEKYQHHTVYLENDTINYHTYSASSLDSVNTLLLYIQGSGPRSLFQVKREADSYQIGSTVPFQLSTIPKDYVFVIISKKGFPFCTELDGDFKVPQSYYENETLDYRVMQANTVLNQLVEQNPHFKNIVALGHSEGSDVVAKLGTVNKEITKIGYWAASGNSQLYDFPLFVRQDVNSGKITEEEALIQMDSLFRKYKDIVANRDDTQKQWLGNSYKRWYYFAEPPVENLLKIEQPIFVAMGTADKSVPIESVYLIPVEFIRHEKDNLTFKIYPDLDHSFRKQTEGGEKESHWNEVFLTFLEWVEETH